MNRPEPGHQNQTRDINCAEQNDRPDLAHRSEQKRLSEKETNPSAWTGNIESVLPTLQVGGLELKQTSARRDEENGPWQSGDQPQVRVKQFHRAKKEEDACEKIGGGTNQIIENAREDRAERTDEVLRRLIRRREITPRYPGRQILGVIGNQCKEEQRSDAEQNDGDDFVPGTVL